MLEAEPGCFGRDIREDERSHSNLGSHAGRDVSGTFWLLPGTLVIYGVHSLTAGTKFKSICENHKLHSDYNHVSRIRGAQGFITLPTNVYKLVSCYYDLLSNLPKFAMLVASNH